MSLHKYVGAQFLHKLHLFFFNSLYVCVMFLIFFLCLFSCFVYSVFLYFFSFCIKQYLSYFLYKFTERCHRVETQLH